jgi:starch phosphorylase
MNLPHKRIAYLSMEIAFDPAMPTYSSDLGILTGDTLRTAIEQAPK